LRKKKIKVVKKGEKYDSRKHRRRKRKKNVGGESSGGGKRKFGNQNSKEKGKN